MGAIPFGDKVRTFAQQTELFEYTLSNLVERSDQETNEQRQEAETSKSSQIV